ncbi:Nicotinamide riboside transporter PnuC [compost metagenome]
MHFFDIQNSAFEVWGYSLSYVELIGTVFGFISVYYASRANILTWGTGIVNEVFLFILFFQVQLYADMFLQVYFFIVTLYGWNNWRKKKQREKITFLSKRQRLLVLIALILGTGVFGVFFSNIHFYLPAYFKLEAAYPFTDSLVMMASILATVLLAKKKMENWYLWILVDSICVILYAVKGIYFLSLEYGVFLFLVVYGLYHWKKLKTDA